MNIRTFSLIAMLIALSVVLNSTHAKDILSVAKQEEQHAVKIGVELHNHVDKMGKSLLSDNPLADTRSLRLRDNKKRPHPVARWLARHNLFALSWNA